MRSDVSDLRSEAISKLAAAEHQLRNFELGPDAERDGWSRQFVELLVTSLADCRKQIQSGWTPPHGSGGYWIRLLMDQVLRADEVYRSVSEAAVSVNKLAGEG
jgi:hypothetical protein